MLAHVQSIVLLYISYGLKSIIWIALLRVIPARTRVHTPGAARVPPSEPPVRSNGCSVVFYRISMGFEFTHTHLGAATDDPCTVHRRCTPREGSGRERGASRLGPRHGVQQVDFAAPAAPVELDLQTTAGPRQYSRARGHCCPTLKCLFWIHRQTAQRIFPLSEIESPLSGLFSQWPVPG